VAYVQQPDTLAGIVKALQRRMSVQENQSVLGNQGIQNGTLTITDESGNPQCMVGLLPDGTYGFGILDPNGTGQIINIRSVAPAVSAAKVDTSESTSSTTFADLATAGPEITVHVGSSGRLLIWVSAFCNVTNSTGGVTASIGISLDGAASGEVAFIADVMASTTEVDGSIGHAFTYTGLTQGAHTLKLQYLVSSGNTATFSSRQLFAMAI
jgi:hypothetical protein